MIVCATRSADGTRRLAARVAEVAQDGDLIVLTGDLGAGKTVFAQGFATALGVAEAVTSPTFTLANRYEGQMVVNHLDVYRFESLAEVGDLALPELLESGVTLVEWGEKIRPALPADQLEVRIEFRDGDDDRVIHLRATGDRWRARARCLSESLHEWVEEDRQP